MVLWLRYQIAKTGKRLQRVTWQVSIGVLLILGSHWLPDEAEREWMRDAGAAIVAVSFTRWRAQQGHRRKDPQTGADRRQPTLRMTPEEAEQMRRLFRK